MCIFGYCRVSTRKQKIERQITNIKKQFPDAVIIEEAYTGTTLNRPQWNSLYKMALEKNKKEKVMIVFDEVSRMSRNASEGFALYEELFNKGIDLVFIKERHLDTEVYRRSLQEQLETTGNEIADIYIEATNKVLMIIARNQIEVAFQTAEHEVDFLHRRTSEGVQKAIAAGKIVGRKEGSTVTTWKEKPVKDIIRAKSKDFCGHNTDAEVMAIIGGTEIEINQHGKTERKKLSIARNTYYKYKKELFENI